MQGQFLQNIYIYNMMFCPGAIDRRPMDDPLTPVHFSADV